MKRIFLLFVCLTISVVSFGQDKPALIATTPEIPPGPSMKETEKWIKRELPNMGRDFVVESVTFEGKTFNVETNYEIAKATLTDCTLKLQSVAESFGNPTSVTATVTMKDLDLSRLVAVEATPYGDSKASKPSYVVILVAKSDPNIPKPFTTLLTGYAGGPTTRSVADVKVRVRDIGSANQAANILRRAAVLCGSQDIPVDSAALVVCEASGSNVFCHPTSVESGNTKSVTTNPSESLAVKMTNNDVIQLVTAKLSDQVIMTSIRQAPAKDFDLTPTGLIALKKAGVSDAVIVVMQEKGTAAPIPSESEAKTPSKYDPTLAEPKTPTTTTTPTPQNGCSGIESLGIYKNTALSAAVGGGVVEWLAKIRNNTSVTKIVAFGWIDMYGQQQKAQAQIKGGEISSLRLDMTQAMLIPPVKELRLLSCQ